MPIVLGGGYENLMIINLQEGVSNKTTEKKSEEVFQNSFNRLSSILKATPNKSIDKTETKDFKLPQP